MQLGIKASLVYIETRVIEWKIYNEPKCICLLYDLLIDSIIMHGDFYMACSR